MLSSTWLEASRVKQTSHSQCKVRISVFIARFREDDVAHRLLSSIVPEICGCPAASVTIMDHNSEAPFHLHPRLAMDKCAEVTIHRDALRLMHSHGQLARSWNEALTRGFGSLDAPNADVVITIQADSILSPGWLGEVARVLHSSNGQLLQFGIGDQLVLQ
jgi:hypothetical protein